MPYQTTTISPTSVLHASYWYTAVFDATAVAARFGNSREGDDIFTMDFVLLQLSKMTEFYVYYANQWFMGCRQ
jgi:hypothetical protein